MILNNIYQFQGILRIFTRFILFIIIYLFTARRDRQASRSLKHFLLYSKILIKKISENEFNREDLVRKIILGKNLQTKQQIFN